MQLGSAEPRLPRCCLIRRRLGVQVTFQLPRPPSPLIQSTSLSNALQKRHICPPLPPTALRRRAQVFVVYAYSHGELQVAWVDRVTGRVCLSISAKAMAITGIEDRRYWSWVPTEESRFNVIAYLQQIWWFEVDGMVKFPFPSDIYTLSFISHLGRFSKRLGRRVSYFDQTHGWDIKPVHFELTTSDGQQASSESFLDDKGNDDPSGNHKRGSWIEYKVGEFIVGKSDPPTDVKFSMKQIDCSHSKGGLCVDSVLIIPSELKGRRKTGVLK